MHPFLQLIASFSEDNHTRGKQFEVLCKWILENDPVYKNKLEKVWLWDDWPDRWGPDCGIDLIAQDAEGKIWAVQAKCYKPNYDVTKKDIDSFLSESSNEKIDVRLLIATTDKIGPNAVSVVHRANSLRSVNQLLLTELLEKQIDWPTSLDDLSSAGVKESYSPRPHQLPAIDNVVNGFQKHERGQLIMACGTGKTLTALFIAEALKSQTILVLLPSLLLLSKTLAEWLRHSKEPFSYLPVCSDDSVSKSEDAIGFTTSDLSFPSTTDEAEIAEFLHKDGKKVIFSTYQSSPQIAVAFNDKALKPIDLVISDEAHRCAGKAGAAYTTILDNNLIPAIKRLFMTATPKIFQSHTLKAAEDSGVDVYSMDDQEVYGPVFHKLSFGAAIANDPPLLTDYQVVIVGVDDSLCAEMIDERLLIQTENKIESDAQSFASHIGLAKALKKYDLRRVITFHSRVSSAKDFQQDFSEVVEWMPEENRPDGNIIANYVSGAMPTNQRNQNLRRLGDIAEGERAILSNARCLSEGVDVPALDGVAFIDPRNSEIDIVQAVGRAIRLSSDKSIGTIVIPVFIAEHDDPDEVLNSSVFKKVWAVVNALRSHDEELGIELDNLRKSLGKRGSVGKAQKIYFDLPTTITGEFEKALSLKVIESTTASWEFWFGLLEIYKEEHNNCDVPSGYKTSDGFALGNWVGTQRKIKDKLFPMRVQRLEALGFVFDPFTQQWEEAFSYLKAYKEEHNDCLVPQGFKTAGGFALAKWVSNQRSNKDKLKPERVQRLDALGFVWDPLIQQWEEGFSHLKTYIDEHSDDVVPSKYRTSDGFSLGRWVTSQRESKSKLTPEKVARLDDLGFVWNVQEKQWEQGFSYLKIYKEEYKDCLVPQSFRAADGFALGNWVSTQRESKSKLPQDKIRLLDDLGFIWNVREYQWEKGFSYLKAYVKEHNHCYVKKNFKSSDGFNLGNWIGTQRVQKNSLTLEKIRRLDKLGFVWESFEQKWEQGFSYLKTYKEEHNHCNVPRNYKTADYFSLGAWVHNQRNYKSRLPAARYQRLEDLGFIWSVLDDQWEQAFSYLKKYKEEYRDCLVPASYKTSNGFALGTWVNNQKQAKNRLTALRVQRLDDLGFVWKVKK